MFPILLMSYGFLYLYYTKFHPWKSNGISVGFEPKDNETNYEVNIAASENGWLNQQEYWIGINNITKGNSWMYATTLRII